MEFTHTATRDVHDFPKQMKRAATEIVTVKNAAEMGAFRLLGFVELVPVEEVKE